MLWQWQQRCALLQLPEESGAIAGAPHPHGRLATPTGAHMQMHTPPSHHFHPLLFSPQDPNTGIAMFESASIIEYLEKTYAE